MGQRHQIYVKMPSKLGIAGFHHQWLYGITAVESLSRVLKFWQNQGEYGALKQDTAYGLKRQSEVIRSIYSTDIETGYWHFVHNLQENDETPSEVKDPRNGDNNDGITIIDISNGDFRYCFMNICHLEGEIRSIPKLKPLTAREYLLAYYPKFFDKKGSRLAQGQSTKEREDIDAETFDRVLMRLLAIEENAKLLTLKECKALFPAMYDLKTAKQA